MNIVHIQGYDRGGGAELIGYQLHREFLAQGHRSLMFVGKKERKDKEIIEIPRIRGIPGVKRLANFCSAKFGWHYLYNPGFRKIIDLIPSDTDIVQIITLHGAQEYSDIGILPRLSKKFPLIMYLHGMWIFTGHCAYSGYDSSCEKWKNGCGKCPYLEVYPPIAKDGTRFNWLRKKYVLSRVNAHIVTPALWLAQRVKESPIISRFPLHIIPNGVDLNIFFPRNKADVRRKLGLPSDKKVILLVAHSFANRFKGMRDAVKALNKAQLDNTIVLVIGKDADEIRKEIRLPTRVFSYQEDRETMAEYYSAADLFVLPSHSEVLPLTVIESMACGIPVVAYAVGGTPELLGDDGECGVLVSPKDVKALSLAIEEILGSPQKMQNMSKSAIKRVREKFSFEKQAGDFLKLYSQVIKERHSK